MTARSEITVTINQPIEKVAQAYSTREYWEFIAEKLSPEPGELNEFADNTATLFEILPKSILPEAAQAMVSQDLKLKRVVTVGELDGDNTKLDYELEAKVNIPFMGAALEPKVADALEEIVENEAKLTEQWISENL